MSGSGQAVLQHQTLGDTEGGWSQTITFDQFDPALGTLQAIDVGVTADMTGSVSFESLEAAPATISVTQSGNVTVSSPTGVLMTDATPYAYAFANLTAYDGTTDDAGVSGGVIALSNTATAAADWPQGSIDLGPFVGTGSVPLAVGATTSLDVTGPANLQIASQASAGASIDLQYNYTGSGPGNQGGGSTGGVFTNLTNNVDPSFFENAVTTAPQTFSFADSTTGWHNNIAVEQFDPTLGTLEAINITLTGDLSTTVGAENEDPSATTVSVTQAATLSLALPSVTETASASTNTWMGLLGYDGTLDFAGTSGAIAQRQTQAPTTRDALTDATDLAAFTGLGTVAVPLSAIGTSHLNGPGNLLARLLAEAGATATVSYTYVPNIPVTDITWSNDAGGAWTDGTNWSSAPGAPGSSDDVAITLPGTYTLNLDTAATVHSIIVDAPDATLVLDANLAVTGDFILDAGTIEFNGGTLSAGEVNVNGGLISGKAVDIESAGTIAITNGSIAAGDFVLQSGLFAVGPVTAMPAGTIQLDSANVALTDAASPNAYFGLGNPGTVTLSSDNTSFHTGAAGDSVMMNGSHDVVFGGTGADTVFGTGDGAMVDGGTGSLLFAGGNSGNATVTGASGAATLYGGTGGNNVLAAGNGKSVVFTGGNDMIWGGSGSDSIVGGGGASTVAAGIGDATVFAFSGAMLVYGGAGSLVFAGGGNGGSTVMGGSGASTLFGGTGGNNVLSAGSGHATLVGGGAGDVLYGGGLSGSVIFAGAGNETLVGSSAGNDTLVAGSGNDMVFAGGGNDMIWGGSGAVSVVGGSGMSTVAAGTGDTTVFAGSGAMLVYGGVGSLVFAGGGNASSTVVGGSGASTLFGGTGGKNLLFAGSGQSILVGGGSGDALVAGGGNDVMFAGSGADSLVAGTGSAQMVAGGGADLFMFINGQAGGNDVVWNFSQGTDRVMLSNYAPDVVATVLSSAVSSGGSTTIMLPDNTRITFGGIAHLTAGDFA